MGLFADLIPPLANTIALLAAGLIMGVAGGALSFSSPESPAAGKETPKRLPGESLWMYWARVSEESASEGRDFAQVSWRQSRVAFIIWMAMFLLLPTVIIIGALRWEWQPFLAALFGGYVLAQVVFEVAKRRRATESRRLVRP